MGIQTIDLLLNYLHQQPSQQQQETPSPSQGASTPTALVAMDSSLWLGGLTYHPIYYLKIYHTLIGSAHLCQLYRHERKLNLPCHDSNTSVGDKDAIYGLFPLLLTLITKAKRLLIELRSQPNNSLIIHPSIISLLVAISGPNYIES